MPISDTLPVLLRRRFLAMATVGAGAALLPGVARATAAERAQALVASLSTEMIALLQAGRSLGQLVADFERILARYGDMAVVAASVLGPPWRSASPAQKQAFVAAFQTYLARKYGRQFTDYQGAQIAIQRARDAGKSGVLVETTVNRPGREPFVVEWQVSERGGSAKVVNLIIEGVSMLTNERAEVGSLLEAEGGNLDRLIARMRAAA